MADLIRSGGVRDFKPKGRRFVVVLMLAFSWLVPAIAGAQPTDEDYVRAEEEARRIGGIEADPAYGAYLGGECAICHQPAASAGAIPPIAGLPADYLALALVEYRAGLRENDVMRGIAARLTDEEIAALAAHFAQDE